MYPALWRHARLSHDPVRGRPALLWPEGLAFINESAAEIVARCDGTRDVAAISDELSNQFGQDVSADVDALVRSLADRELLTLHSAPTPVPVRDERALARASDRAPVADTKDDPSPTTLLAEVTYRCPLHCPYCSNPVELNRRGGDLSTHEWTRVLDDARALGVLQLGLSGGEPLVRKDTEQLIAHARGLGMYVTLVTSGVGLTESRAAALGDSGIEHIQLSLQDAERAGNDRIGGAATWDRKLEAARLIRGLGVAFTVNAVLHRDNIGHLESIAALAAELGAERLELANTQYYGWALANRSLLLPTREQLAEAEQAVARARARFAGRMRILYVVPDYHERTPKPCMGGWGRRYVVITPDGLALPCHAARSITTLSFESVRDRPLSQIWRSGDAFRAFRGEAWMPSPCKTCEKRHLDFGGCRCQAFLVAGDAALADPVCELSEHRKLIDSAITDADLSAVRSPQSAAPSSLSAVRSPQSAVPSYRYRTEPTERVPT